MEPLLDFGLEATRWLQHNFPQLEGAFAFISALGTEQFYLVLLPLIYWNVDKQFGRSMAYVVLFSNATNALLKHTFRAPRPFWLDRSIGLADEVSYGIPSGHAQLAATLYLFTAAWIKRGWVWIVAVFMAVAMGLSRIYLGVHFVHDVVGGFLLALVVLLGFALWKRYLANDIAKRILGQRLLIAVTVATAFAIIYALIRFLIGEPNVAVDWSDRIAGAEQEGIESMAAAIGLLLGIGVGVNLEASRTRFRVSGPVWQRLLRYIVGIAVTVAIWGGLKMVFPAEPLWLAVPLRIFRYFLVAMWIGYYAPAAFVRLRLAEADPEPEISLKL